jgi:hypothetical protein
MASQDVNHFALRYAPLSAGLEHAIDLGPQCGQPSDLVIDGVQCVLAIASTAAQD